MRLLIKGIIFLFFIQLSANSWGSNLGYAGGNEPLGWELITESFGIEVYERWVITDTKLKVRERSGKMILHCSIDEVIELISDLSKLHLWMNNVEKVELLKSISQSEWYQRTVLDAPWPFSKQDMVSKYIVSHESGSPVAKVDILRETQLYPKQDGIDRLDSFNACWEIEELSDNRVKVTFTTSSTKPPQYPAWVQDPVVRNMFFSNLKNFKKVISANHSS